MSRIADLIAFRPSRRRRFGRHPWAVAGEVVGGVALFGAAAVVAYWLRERSLATPAYRTLRKQDSFSLRRYAPMTVASTRADGPMIEALDRGYDRLSAYIGAKPEGRAPGASDERIAMAAPVGATAAADHPGGWTISFVMPRDGAPAVLPEPAADIAIAEVPDRLVAALRFAGRWTDDELIARKRRQLIAWATEQGLAAVGEPTFAAYNAPFVPPPARHNEWLLPVRDEFAR